MAKKAHPWFWEARQAWYVTLHGQQHLLGRHPEKAPKPVKSDKTGRWNSPAEIDAAFRRLLGGGSPQEEESGERVIDVNPCLTIIWTDSSAGRAKD